ncbi:SusC/RagA family TonB-linked outer membrane protein [Hufsiella ginkgonis]|uniref:SusC/RagA family TonB-linked outer membrane protein n=1 Tax=Hufsiella ginkgonis TaxID=2695274 RepID=A0A7K1XT05_9SPHI|nr:SusC/RagA family TonB-linked outer membrane protein [Hufsiella ginkgonis]MXV13988.1 SusC/RagA family TonB-linked outer membrane protein [Hufsiella ginkgonis]
MRRQLLAIMLLVCAIGTQLYAQAQTVTGVVTDKADGSPLPGVSVMVPGSKTGTQTGPTGRYSIVIPAGGPKTLKFTYIGYITQTVAVTRATLDVTLENDAKTLSEVVVTGYGTQRKKDMVGSVATVTAEDLVNKPVQSFDQALGGKAAGVQITIPNGVLNNPPVIRVRGINSISLSSYPLIVVDGIATYTGDVSGSSAAGNALASINPNDIESVDILKDAAAAAIYGSRAANGVLIITTKKGKKGKPVVSYDAWVGQTKIMNMPELLDAFQYTELKNTALKNAGTYNAATMSFNLVNDANGNPINTNWYDVVYRKGTAHSNSVSLAGGSETTNYYFSGGYTGQKGIIRKNDYNRANALLKIDHKEGNIFNMGGKIQFSNEQNLAATSSGSLSGEAFGTGGLGRLAIVTAPNVAVRNNDGTYNVQTASTIGRMGNKGSDVGFYNPGTVLDLDRSNNELNHLQSNVYLQANILPWLNAKTTYGVDYLLSDNDSFNNPINGGSAASLGSASESYTKNKRWVWTNTIQADRTFMAKHSVSLLLGNEQQRSVGRGFGAGRTTLSDLAFNDFTAGYTAAPSNSASFGENYLVSFFSRLSYDFDKKYFVTGNIRQDEYSAFGAGNKKGIFYGVGLGWEVAKEAFWEKAGLDKVFSSFKFRGSYGTVGNINGLGNLASYSFYSTGLYAGASTLVPSQTGNDQIAWEESRKFDAGFNLGIMNDKFTAEFAYYKNDLKGLIYNVPQIPSVGLPSTPQANIASMYNKGVELTLNAQAVATKNFSWTPSFNISYNKNVVTALSEGLTQFITTTSSLESASISRVGGPLGMIYVVKTEGVDPATGRRIFIKSDGRKVMYQHVVPAGQFRWSYENGTDATGISLAADGSAYKNTQPKFYGGFDNSFRYKKFDLNATITYQLGFYIYYGTYAGLRDQRFWNNSTDMLQAWTAPNQVTNIPKVYFGDNVSNGSSFPISDNVFKGDFVKLRSIDFGYSLPGSFLTKLKMASARVYVSGNNLLFVTKYPGSDPEVSSNGNSTSSSGVDRNSVGNGRTFTAGISAKF